MNDKELTIEVVKVIASGWANKNVPLKSTDITSLINDVYDTISNLKADKQNVTY